MSAVHMDYNVLTSLQEVMEDEYLTLLEVFVKDSDLRISLLRQAASLLAVDSPTLGYQELSLTAHSFKGSSSNMGAVQLSDLCRELEERARSRQPEGIAPLIEEIDSEYQAVRELFDAERQSLMAQT